MVKNLKPGIFLVTVDCDITTNLLAAKYTAFKPDLEFAGVSLRGALLSYPKAGTAAINGIPVHATPPKKWELLQGTQILTNTNLPSFIIHPTRNGASIYIQPDHLIPRYQLQWDYRPNSYSTDLATALWFHEKHPTCHIAQRENDYDVVIPADYEISSVDWERLGQHNVTTKSKVSSVHVVPIESTNQIQVKAQTTDQAHSLYGIKGEPTTFDKNHLSYNTVKVLDHSKAKNIHPLLQYLHSAHVYHSPVPYVLAEGILKNPKLGQHIKDCKDEWDVYPDFSKLALKWSSIPVDLLEWPLVLHWPDREPLAYVQPKHLAKFFTSVKQAARTHQLDKLIKYRVNTTGDGSNEFGFFVSNKELALAPIRDPKAEQERLAQREQALTTKYGQALPAGWHEHADAKLDTYFDIINKFTAGELIPLEEFKLIPPDTEDIRQPFDSWLREQDLIITCPITRKDYVKNILTIDELAEYPGFFDTLCQACGQKEFLVRVLLSDKIKANILARNL